MDKKKQVEVDAVLDLAVSYGNVNIGDKTARIGITVARSVLKVTVADKQLCEKRLAGCMVAKRGNPDQPTFNGMEDDLELTVMFDVKGFNVSADHISFGLTFALKSVDVQTLAQFAKREGQLIITSIEAIPEDEDDGGEGEDDTGTEE